MIKRRAIAIDLLTAVKAIRATGGYSQDVTPADVFPWRVNTVPNKEDQEIISVNDVGNTYEDDSTLQVLTFEVIVGITKGADNYEWIVNRAEDIWKCLYAAWPSLKTKYGYFVMKPGKDEINIYNEGELETAEAILTIDIVHDKSTKWVHNSTDY